jgi:hypothetical protein
MQEFGGGSILGMRLMAHKIVVIAHPDLIRVVLTGNYKTFPKQKEYSRMKDLLGECRLHNSPNISPPCAEAALPKYISKMTRVCL